MPVNLTGYITPLNAGFTGMVEDDQVIDTLTTATNIMISDGTTYLPKQMSGDGTLAADGTLTLTGTGEGGHNHDGDTLQLDAVNSNGGNFTFQTSGDLILKPDDGGTGSDKTIGFSVGTFLSSEEIFITYAGDQDRLVLTHNTASPVGLWWYNSDTQYGRLQLSKIDDTFDFTATHALHLNANSGIMQFISSSTMDFKPSGDTDDFIQFQTLSNIPEITTSGSSNLKITSSGGLINFGDNCLIDNNLEFFFGTNSNAQISWVSIQKTLRIKANEEGGNISLVADSTTTEAGGNLTFTAGNASGATDAGGSVSISAGGGLGSGASNGGDVDINAGTSINGTGGNIDMDVLAGGEIQLDGGLVDIGTGNYALADGDNDLGVAGDLEVVGTHRMNTAAKIEFRDTAIFIHSANDGELTLTADVEIVLSGEVESGDTIGFPAQSATGDGNTTIDWGLGNKFNFTFGAFNETFTFTDPANPANFILKLTQDATGSRTATWPASVKWPGGTAPTLTTAANSVDIVSFYFDGTNYYGLASLDFS